MPPHIRRSAHNPIVHPAMDERILGNVNGPSLVRVPDWIDAPLGRYYLYFAHHQGTFIRMAYSDEILGPYTVHSPGVLDIGATPFSHHIASPDVHVDDRAKKIRMVYHGLGFTGPRPEGLSQNACYAESDDGLRFVGDHTCLGPSYLRVFAWDGWHYGFAGSYRSLWRARDPREPFERGPQLAVAGEDYTRFADPSLERPATPVDLVYRMRHPALHLRGHRLDIYYSNVGDAPERIKRTTVDLRPDWTRWVGTPPEEVLRSETAYEGRGHPVEPSVGGASHEPVHQVRDPYLYAEDDRAYLVYTVAGESGLGIAELVR